MGRILIADDEAKILEVMIDVLENAGHEVTGVADGEAAVVELKKGTYDVALLDVMMPKLNGYEVAAQIINLPNRPGIVIVTAARNFEVDKGVLSNVGADAFLPKPFSNKDLLKVVKDLLLKRGGS
jgi:CheY-like chemotaxis protein